MKHFFTLFLAIGLSFVALAQRNTGINTTNPSSKAALDVHTDGSLKQGILVPRLSVADTTVLKSGIPNHSKGLLFYDTVNTVYRYWTGSKWQAFGGGTSSSSSADWLLSGNTLVPADTQSTGFKYLGTNSPFPLILATDGRQRMRISRNGNIGIGMNPTGGIPLSLKSNGLGQVFSIERSKGDNLFEFREDANLNAKLQMYDVDGSPTVEFNADPKLYSHLNTLGFGIGNVAPAAMLDVAGDFATRPTSIDLSAADSYYALGTKGVSVYYVTVTSASGAKIHGMADGVPGKHLYITNRTSSPVIFIDNSGDVGVAITDLIIIGGLDDYQILNGQTAHFIYVGGRWRLVTAPSTATGGSLTGTGLANKVAFWNGSSNLTYNTNLHWNNTNSRLGIGTTTTTDPLTVQAGTQTGIGLIGTGSISMRMYFNASNNFIFESGTPIKFYPNGAGEALHIDDGDIIASVPFTANSSTRITSLVGPGVVTANATGLLSLVSGTPVMGVGAANKVAFWTNNSTLGQNTLFHWDNTNERLGIGWAAPISPLHLHVAGNLPIYQAFTNVTTGITPATDGFWVGVNAIGTAELTQKEASSMTFATSNIERIRIASNGNVGIGTNAPTSILNVVTSAYSPVDVICYNNFTNAPGSVRVGFSRGTIATPLAVQNANNIGEFTFLGYNGTSMANGAWIRASATEDWTGTANGTSLSFMTRGNGSTLNLTRMTIDESGNVGIGIGAAATKLEVSGALTLTRTSLTAPANNSTVTVGDNSFLFITTPTTGSSTIILSEGLKAGQLLFIMCTGGAGTISLTDSTSNVLLSSSPYAMGSTDTIFLIYNGASWVEVSRSNN